MKLYHKFNLIIHYILFSKNNKQSGMSLSFSDLSIYSYCTEFLKQLYEILNVQ